MKTLNSKFLMVVASCLFTALSFAQKGASPEIVSRTDIFMKAYHNKEDLKGKNKGELITLYIERANTLATLVSYYGVTNTPATKLADLGIPDDEKNKKMVVDANAKKAEFVASNEAFLRQMLAYSDTSKIVDSILLFEELLKNLKAGN
jgi:hypothetical protein